MSRAQADLAFAARSLAGSLAGSIGQERPVGREHMHVRVEVGEVARSSPSGLNEQDQPRARTGGGFGVRLGKQSRSDAAQLPQPCALPAEHRAQQLRDGEHVLAVRHRREHLRLDPLGVEQHALLLAARTEVPRLARIGEQVVVAASVAVDAGKTIVRVAALDEASDHLRFERAARTPGGLQPGGVALCALPRRARAWPARAIRTRRAPAQAQLPQSLAPSRSASPSTGKRASGSAGALIEDEKISRQVSANAQASAGV